MSLRFAALMTALGVYGLLGSPTPDHPGMVEAALAGLLILAAFPDAVSGLCTCFTRSAPGWERAGWAFFLYAATLPLLLALMRDNPQTNIGRDLIFVVFFLIPLWLGPLVRARAGGAQALRAALIWIGLAFSVRSIFPPLNDTLPGVDVSAPLYLAIAPCVLFAGLWLAGQTVFRTAYGGLGPRNLVHVGALAAATLAPLLALVLTLQRVSLLAIAICLMLWGGRILWRTPPRAIVPALIALGIFAAGWDDLMQVVHAVSVKTNLVGVNSRLDEARVALEAVSENTLSALFGRGWGAEIPSPATAGVRVNFTHSLVTMLWVKTGLAGLLLAGVYLWGLGMRMVRMVARDPVLSLSMLLPILIDVFLYASYKSLDFGLVLLLAATTPFLEKRTTDEDLPKSGFSSGRHT